MTSDKYFKEIWKGGSQVNFTRAQMLDFADDYKTYVLSQANQKEEMAKASVMPRTLAAENGDKALLSGEFFQDYTYTYYDDDLNEDVEFTAKVPVSWQTIKEIYAKIANHYGV